MDNSDRLAIAGFVIAGVIAYIELSNKIDELASAISLLNP